MKKDKIRVGISHGDINGVGYEVIMKTLMDNRMMELCTPIVYGSPKVAAYHRKALNISNFSFNHIRSASEADSQRANIINCIDDNIRVELGKSTQIAGEASFIALEHAVKDLKEGKIDVLVTAPINKDNIQSEYFNFPGHTEYLSDAFDSHNHLMLMVSGSIKIGVVAGHVPIAEVPSKITKGAILKKLRTIQHTLEQDFSVKRPRIAVLGLNPHAGDNGLLGTEEQEVIIPSIERAKEEGILAMGPYPADGFFGSSEFNRFDAILAMYHDQGLIPFKAMSFDNGVNYTAGLPVIRTSPAHGTAYNIAGEDKASADSFRNAVYLAIDIFKSRSIYQEISQDPLKKQEIEQPTVDEDVDLTQEELPEDI
ncbi:4-hydroxythreonine-4-phosphate dehydrogenase PdxA [Puteibacter caeruleilacunae]|nr:4-hydroxythreonine-4-phosphate dehydrogenase PdxA [Puteibacter caeruleilacunae]